MKKLKSLSELVVLIQAEEAFKGHQCNDIAPVAETAPELNVEELEDRNVVMESCGRVTDK